MDHFTRQRIIQRCEYEIILEVLRNEDNERTEESESE